MFLRFKQMFFVVNKNKVGLKVVCNKPLFFCCFFCQTPPAAEVSVEYRLRDPR